MAYHARRALGSPSLSLSPSTGRRPILAIDFGSTCCRAVLYDPETSHHWEVKFGPHSNFTTGYNLSDLPLYEIPAVGRPFDDPYHVGVMAYKAPQNVSLKAFLYVLAGTTFDVRGVMDDRLRNVPEGRLRGMLHRFFRIVRSRIDQIARIEGSYGRIALTIPSFWDERLQVEYEKIISHVWSDWQDALGSSQECISFITETEAQAHFMIRRNHGPQHAGADNTLIGDETSLLFIDLGGHSMGGCMFWRPDPTNLEEIFYVMDSPFGEIGGDEIFVQLIRERIDEELAIRPDLRAIKERFVTQFYEERKSFTPDLSEDVYLETFYGVAKSIFLSARVIRECHVEAYRRAFRVIAEKADNMTAIANGMTDRCAIVYTGGSFQSVAVQQEALNIAEERGIKDIWRPDHESTRLCYGAAMAVGEQLTATEFIERGAGFGIRVAEEDTASVLNLVRQSLSGPTTIVISKKAMLKIVCDPIFRLRTDYAERISCDDCYDLHELGDRYPGHYQFRMKWIVSSNGESSFRLEEYRKVTDAQGSRSRQSTWQGAKTVELPLYCDGGNNCIHVDIDAQGT